MCCLMFFLFLLFYSFLSILFIAIEIIKKKGFVNIVLADLIPSSIWLCQLVSIYLGSWV